VSDLDRLKRWYGVLNRSVSVIAPGEPTTPFDERFAGFLDRFDPAPEVPPHQPRDVQLRGAVDDGAVHSGTPQGGPATPHELSADARRARLEELATQIRQCQRCPLSIGRTNAVPGRGVLDPLVMIVGEGPGAQEDAEGEPFVGNAGQYLDKWLTAIGLSREENVFIANIVKCRPPGNRDPSPEESDACRPYLQEQIALVQPRLILTLGRISMRILTGTSHGITRVHGTMYHYEGIPLIPTFHPSGVLRNPAWRRPVWDDLKTVRNWLIDNAGHTAARTE
jgi:uracil-DNA glycosylase family 4